MSGLYVLAARLPGRSAGRGTGGWIFRSAAVWTPGGVGVVGDDATAACTSADMLTAVGAISSVSRTGPPPLSEISGFLDDDGFRHVDDDPHFSGRSEAGAEPADDAHRGAAQGRRQPQLDVRQIDDDAVRVRQRDDLVVDPTLERDHEARRLDGLGSLPAELPE